MNFGKFEEDRDCSSALSTNHDTSFANALTPNLQARGDQDLGDLAWGVLKGHWQFLLLHVFINGSGTQHD